ncbi:MULTISPECIES: hypothetical protein [unclassified Brevundimonas]|uniref:hypothetical protein n=1 Tax=unclassified Brevundimonas TaxID=2622653 RepID=UPI002003CA66|nr:MULTISPECIES: hypothetical protein [unclassified Brevundimonas]MCK6105878.1 hypothetical protein [Brevundimonas sp. EYE_349]
MRKSILLLLVGIGLVSLCVARAHTEMQIEALALIPLALLLWVIAFFGGATLVVVGLVGLLKAVRRA